MKNLSITKVLILLLCYIPMTSLTAFAAQINQQKTHPEYAPDEIIIKLKPASAGALSITQNGKITGLISLDKLNQKYGITKIQPVIKKVIIPIKKLSPKAQELYQGLHRICKIKISSADNLLDIIS